MTVRLQLKVRSVNVGMPEEIGQTTDGTPIMSAITKRPSPYASFIAVQSTGIYGDTQVNTKHHGVDRGRTIYAMPWLHTIEYAALLGIVATPGELMGENLTLTGLDGDWEELPLTEDDVHIGDVFSWGLPDSLLEVTNHCVPCDNLTMRFPNGDRLASHMRQTGNCGWYFKVVGASGFVAALDDPLVLVKRGQGPTIRESFFGKSKSTS